MPSKHPGLVRGFQMPARNLDAYLAQLARSVHHLLLGLGAARAGHNYGALGVYAREVEFL